MLWSVCRSFITVTFPDGTALEKESDSSDDASLAMLRECAKTLPTTVSDTPSGRTIEFSSVLLLVVLVRVVLLLVVLLDVLLTVELVLVVMLAVLLVELVDVAVSVLVLVRLELEDVTEVLELLDVVFELLLNVKLVEVKVEVVLSDVLDVLEDSVVEDV